MKDELRQFAENDPAVLDAMGTLSRTFLLYLPPNRARRQDGYRRCQPLDWSAPLLPSRAHPSPDNIFTLRSWAADKFNVEKTEFNKNFAIPADFDYYEPKL